MEHYCFQLTSRMGINLCKFWNNSELQSGRIKKNSRSFVIFNIPVTTIEPNRVHAILYFYEVRTTFHKNVSKQGPYLKER